MGRPIRYRVSFTLGGKQYEVVPTFEYIDHVEQHIESQYALGRALERGHYRHSDLAHVIHSALVTSGYNLTYADVGQMLTDEKPIAETAIIAGKIVMASQNVDPDTLTVTLSDGSEVDPEDAEGKEHAVESEDSQGEPTGN